MSIKITTLNALKAKPRFPMNLTGRWERLQLPGLGVSGAPGVAEQGLADLAHPPQPGQGRPGGNPSLKHLRGDGDRLGHQPVAGSQGPDPGDAGLGTCTAMALRELVFRWGQTVEAVSWPPAPKPRLWEAAFWEGLDSCF